MQILKNKKPLDSSVVISDAIKSIKTNTTIFLIGNATKISLLINSDSRYKSIIQGVSKNKTLLKVTENKTGKSGLIVVEAHSENR